MVKDRLVEIAMTMKLSVADQDLHRDDRMMRSMVHQIRTFPAMALPSMDDPVILCGVAYNCGVGELWMLTSESFATRWRSILRQHKQACAMVYEALGLHRMHILVDPRRPEACAYAEALGFKFEYTAARFGAQGVDMSFYVWPHDERIDP